jgi:hypothetical protein
MLLLLLKPILLPHLRQGLTYALIYYFFCDAEAKGTESPTKASLHSCS